MLKRMMMVGPPPRAVAAIVPLRAEIIEQVLVKVNGDIITQTRVREAAARRLQERPELAKLTPNSPQLAQAIAEVDARADSRSGRRAALAAARQGARAGR